ncbi:kinase-like protein [Rickenella mellea]|uniref:Kinase-like protein n=1 Tax=Rickenella mellea TaxID=50990 RepID=A0A4Y7Q8P1_9AGAM|nr:kinase-like protein [Rickenella mellea]
MPVADDDDFPKWARLTAERAAYFEKATNEGLFRLTEREIWWRDHADLLETHGYRLRPRFRPNWKPSWLGTDHDPYQSEDSAHLLKSQIIDATRIKDGKAVVIKRITNGAEEIRVSTFFSTPERLKDRRNHCVPILDHFQDRTQHDLSFIVMPLLRKFDDPPFQSAGEVIEFMRQLLEGLEFMHEQNVAHRDLAKGNIMMDGHALFPKGFHPTSQMRDPSTHYPAEPLRRRDVTELRYYIIDFGISTTFTDPSEPRLVTGTMAQATNIPELSDMKPYDPFAVDVYTLAHVFLDGFMATYTNFSYLLPLMKKMASIKPASRPTAAEARMEFENIVRTVKGRTLRWPLRPREEGVIRRVVGTFAATAREAVFLANSIFRDSH